MKLIEISHTCLHLKECLTVKSLLSPFIFFQSFFFLKTFSSILKFMIKHSIVYFIYSLKSISIVKLLI